MSCSVWPQADRNGRDEQQQRGHDEGEPEMVRMQLHTLPLRLAARMLFMRGPEDLDRQIPIRARDYPAERPSVFSVAATNWVVATKLSGFREMESIPASTRNAANSG